MIDPITLDSSIEMEIWVSDESSYISHYACRMLCATDVAFKSYKRKRSESYQEFVVTTIFELSQINVNFAV